jgi:hypothetical protein
MNEELKKDRMKKRQGRMVIGAVIAVVIIGGFIWWGSRVLVGESELTLTQEEPHFPQVSGYNLMREEFNFPEDFLGDYNLVIIPFQQIQQRDVNTWLPAAQELERTIPGFIYYELPTIYQLPTLSRTFINEGMRAGIPDQTARERTITFYLDKEVFKKALDITTEDKIQIFLVDKQGTILWREEGLFSSEKNQSLIDQLSQLQ